MAWIPTLEKIFHPWAFMWTKKIRSKIEKHEKLDAETDLRKMFWRPFNVQFLCVKQYSTLCVPLQQCDVQMKTGKNTNPFINHLSYKIKRLVKNMYFLLTWGRLNIQFVLKRI